MGLALTECVQDRVWGLQSGGCFVLDELAHLEHLPSTSSGRKFGKSVERHRRKCL